MAPLPQSAITPATVLAIYAHYEKQEQWEGRTLSLSTLADPCERKLWYDFRWASRPERIDGRTLRLFQTGNIEEDRFVEELRAIGCEVIDRDPDTGRQITVTAVGGHLKGKLDAEVLGLPEAPKTIHVAEMKSHNEKSFKALKKLGVREAKELHFGQMQAYMHLRQRERAIYLAVCKNNDELYAERVNYDVEYCLRMFARGERIVKADDPPSKLHEDPESKMAFACRFCKHLGICHEGRKPRVNCRTCIHASAETIGDKGVWTCARWSKPLTHEEMLQGCPNHLLNPGLVDGEQIDMSEEEEWIEYRMKDGTTWRDGGTRDASE